MSNSTTEQGKRRSRARITCMFGAVAMITPIIAIALAPWINARPVPVELRLGTSASSRISISWDDSSDRLPMVHYPAPAGELDNLFLAELPPRPQYHLVLHFHDPLTSAAFRRIRLIDVRNVDQPLFARAWSDDGQWFTTRNISVSGHERGYLLTSTGESELEISQTIVIPRPPIVESTLGIWIFLMLGIGAIAATIIPLFRLLNLQPMSSASSARPMWIAFVVATILQLCLLAHAPVVLAGGDTGGYLYRAVNLAEHGTVATGGSEFELNRLPGYPLFLAIALKISAYHLSRVALLQGLFYCVSALALALSLRRWLNPYVAAVAIFVAILSPPQVWAARSILSESVFGSACLLAMAALFMHIHTRGRAKAFWLISFALISTYSFFVRPNGVVLAFALVPICVPQLAKILRSRPGARRALGYVVPYAAITLIPIAFIGLWSIRNDIYRGFFGPSDMDGVTRVCGLIASGTFDVRSIADTPEYDDYLIHKNQSKDYYPGFQLRHEFYLRQTDGERSFDKRTLTRLNQTMLKIVADSSKHSPWQDQAMGLVRSVWWAVAWPDVEAFSTEGIRLDYVSFDNISAVPKGVPSLTVQENRDVFLLPISKRLVYDEVRHNWIYDSYALLANGYYNGWYVTIFVLGVIGAIYVSWRGEIFLSAPTYMFLANVALNVVLLNVFSRYIHILDGLLYFQIALAIDLALRRRKGQPVAVLLEVSAKSS